MTSPNPKLGRRLALGMTGGAVLGAMLAPPPSAADASSEAAVQRLRAIAAGNKLYTAISNRDLAAFAALWAPDAVSHFPVTPPGDLVGRDAIAGAIDFLFQAAVSITMSWQIKPLLDPHEVIGVWTMHAPLTWGAVYDNRGAQILHVEGTLITEATEFFDTAAFHAAFG